MDEQLAEVQSYLTKYEKLLKGHASADNQYQLDRTASVVRTELAGLRMEIQECPDPDLQAEFSRLADSLDETFKALKKENEQKKAQSRQRDLVFSDKAEDIALLSQGGMATQDLDSLILQADKVQDATQSSLDASKKHLAEVEGTGAQVLGNLGTQREQLEGVAEGLEDIEDGQERATLLVRQLAKSAVGDRCVECLCLTLSVGIIGIIVVNLTG